MVSYEEWLKVAEFGLRRKYKIKDIIVDDEGLHIFFTNNFNYWTSAGNLKALWEMDSFIELCNDIEREFVCQIINI